MITLSRDYSQKLRIIRKSEGLTQQKFAEITGLAVGTIKRYETHQQTARAEVMEKVLQAPEFRKYTMWLMHDEIAPSAGQIAPALAHCGTDVGEAQKQRRKTGEDSDVKSSRYGRRIG